MGAPSHIFIGGDLSQCLVRARLKLSLPAMRESKNVLLTLAEMPVVCLPTGLGCGRSDGTGQKQTLQKQRDSYAKIDGKVI